MGFDYDVVVVGGGPAGLAATIYASRANLRVGLIEAKAVGGKIPTTAKIENWPGDRLVEGPDLAFRMYEHALSFGATYLPGSCELVTKEAEGSFKVSISDSSGTKQVTSRSVVIASGMINRKPPVEGIEEYENRGVSYCVVCDGSLFKDQPSAIIGDGNSAVEEAIYLAAIVPKLYLFALNPVLRAERIISERLLSLANVEVHYRVRPTKVIGDKEGVKGIVVRSEEDGKERSFEVGSIFPYIGFLPVNGAVKGFDIFDEAGFIVTDEDMQTSVKGLFAVGDIRRKSIRQITTAVSDGTIAAKFLANELSS